MKTNLILKTMLLYTTLSVSTFIIIGIESLYDRGYLVWIIIIATGLIYWCKKVITKEEFNIISLNNFFKNQGL